MFTAANRLQLFICLCPKPVGVIRHSVFHVRCVTVCVPELLVSVGTVCSITDVSAVVCLAILQQHLDMGSEQENQVRIYTQARDRIALLPWKYKRLTTLVCMFVKKLNHRRCCCCFVVVFWCPSSRYCHCTVMLKWLLGYLLAHSLSLNLHSPTAVRLTAPGNTPAIG